jgi:hypothetical protein
MFQSSLLLAASTATTKVEPLFGNQWLALLAILAGVTVFLFAVAALGRWLASTHPDAPAPAPAPASAVAASAPVAATDSEVPANIFAIISAAVAVTFGSKARIAGINSGDASGSTDYSRQQWSMEGRRQIYSSHKVR